MQTVFFSHKMEVLASILADRLEQSGAAPLQKQIVLTPNASVKQWLLIELARRKGIAMGIEFPPVEKILFPKEFCRIPNRMELFGLIYRELGGCQEAELLAYLEGKPRKRWELAEQLVRLFSAYGEFGERLFDPERETVDWQHGILKRIFVEGGWRLPVQARPFQRDDRSIVHCFGIDSFPPVFWDSLFRFSSLSVYLFSPCAEFWEDVCSERERKNWIRRARKKAVHWEELDAFLRQAPPLLANFGKVGRETLKELDRFDPLIEEAHSLLEPSTLLKKMQAALLRFQKNPEEKEEIEDDSIQLCLTGSSRLREVEALRDRIWKLVSERGVKFEEIAVLAPDIAPYAPLVEYVFSDREAPIPYRVASLDLGAQSSFLLGLSRLLDLSCGRWDAKELLALFETPSFYRKMNWTGEQREKISHWIAWARIDWGWDPPHKQKILSETIGGAQQAIARGTWEKGLDALLDAAVFLFPSQTRSNLQMRSEDLEEFFDLLARMRKSLSVFSGEKTLAEWASLVASVSEEFLSADLEEEADAAAFPSFRQTIKALKQAEIQEALFPFEAVRPLLHCRCQGQIHASHLHAVRFASLSEAASIPARALFLIGMDEESFPRSNPSAPLSLNLLKKEGMMPLSQGDRDRYDFLQALFSAEEYLTISYSHLTADEGKPVGPSLVVQELFSDLDAAYTRKGEKISAAVSTVYAPSLGDARHGEPSRNLWPDMSRCPPLALPEGEMTVSVADLKLLASHPWKFYLQKAQNLFLRDLFRLKEDGFALQKASLQRRCLRHPLEDVLLEAEEELPPRLLGEALRLEVSEKAAEWQERLKEWGVAEIFSLRLQESCAEPKMGLHPPVEVVWGGRLKVRIVGEIQNVSALGWICLQDDQIGGLIKGWPEALIAACALGVPQVLMLKSGKVKKLGDPQQGLKSFLEYYFRSLSSPSPLLSEWADPLLRKGAAELEKKKEALLDGLGRKQAFEDPWIDWVAARAEIPSAEKLIGGWQKDLQGMFADLAALYPARSKKGEEHAAV